MDELIQELERFRDLTSVFSLADVAIVMLLSFVLSAAMALVYRGTHRGTSYSQSFAQTLVLMGMVTALIMLIIGSNIARAFSLVGALSVIRFRNAVKETRDVGQGERARQVLEALHLLDQLIQSNLPGARARSSTC